MDCSRKDSKTPQTFLEGGYRQVSEGIFIRIVHPRAVKLRTVGDGVS
jgi:hypothetical protein